MAIAAGKLGFRVQIQSLPSPETQDAYGQATQTWTTIGQRWARIRPLAGLELFQAAQVRPDVTHELTIRYFEGLTPKHRLLVRGRVFNILGIVDVENFHVEHRLTCKEEV